MSRSLQLASMDVHVTNGDHNFIPSCLSFSLKDPMQDSLIHTLSHPLFISLHNNITFVHDPIDHLHIPSPAIAHLDGSLLFWTTFLSPHTLI